MEKLEPLEVIVDGGIFVPFANLTKDNNPIHTDKIFAISSKFNDTPAQGVYLISCFEQFARLNGFGFDNYSVKFKTPAFPGDRLQFIGKKESGKMSVEVKNQNSELLASCNINSTSPPSFDLSGREPVRSFDYSLTPHDSDTFYSLLGFQGDRFPHSLVSSLIPASLLKLEGDKILTGVYRGIDVSSFNSIGPGNYKVDIFNQREPRKMGEAFIYDLFGVCSEKSKTVLSGNIVVISPRKLNI